MTVLTDHASKRCAQRGVTGHFVQTFLALSDVEQAVGNNCRLMRVSRVAAADHADRDKLSRYAVVWSDDSHKVVTILPVYASRRRGRYNVANISRGSAR